jgi:hypothetical protein
VPVKVCNGIALPLPSLQDVVLFCGLDAHTIENPKYSGLMPPSIQQLWLREAPVDGRTTMSRESVCQVTRSWVDVSNFHTRLVVGFMIFTLSVQIILDTPSYIGTLFGSAALSSYIVSADLIREILTWNQRTCQM